MAATVLFFYITRITSADGLGQYKIPQGLESSAKLDLVERLALSAQFKWADFGNTGFTLT